MNSNPQSSNPQSSKYDLIIFDCDGTLVDTEYLNNKVSSDGLIRFGLQDYTPQRCTEEFTGKSWTEIKSILEARHSLEIPRYIIDDYIQEVQEQMERYIRVVDGALDVVTKSMMKTKVCVASNGMRVNVVRSLELNGFMDLFHEGQIFTKIQVKNPKPFPDLFLYAAEQMGVPPEKTLVIEDSVTGVRAAVAAGMEVWGFTGVSHDSKRQETDLKLAGARRVFNQFIHIGDALGY